ncbi:hybrid sensor histidine kinase/response regulator [Massilia atriviolacea]|uniref:histidine kinase n=1 Tax=Massilia atriviolacea TaxID=2495579 RepID=A0A430HJQ2_9BURK|nr:response regulator [Massilia atriviolacea]RSZ57730.1 hybrid sensor histidine kinase/response regulator [Massilia atriviolacea]
MQSTSFADSLILNVDDSEGARYAKSRILTRAGFRVIEAADGNSALLRAREDKPDLVLLDVKLPDINGFEVCRLLKADPETRAVLVLQTSASYIGVADKIRALEGGADNYLFEPIEPEELVANVKALLRLGQVERELRDVDRRKDEFLATLAHELRNPLGPIRNAVELLCRLDPNVPERQDKARQTILRHTGHLVRLVEDLLDVARISKGKITLHEERVELQTFIGSARESVAHIAESRNQRLEVALPAHEVWLSGDHVRLGQIVGNLLHNAFKFTPPGGIVKLSAEVAGQEIVIRVADNGIGIAANKLDVIFDLFAQDGFTPDRVQDGLGIGLSLVRTLVTLHHGTVSASSAGVDQGSVFEVRLPIDAIGSGDAGAQAAGADAAATRILVVDDNVDAADMLAELLGIGGHDVKVAYNGQQALERAAQFRPAYVFLDIGLPDMSGYQVAAKMRELPGMDDALLVALTGYGQARDREQAMEAGFDDHIVKPIDFAKVTSLDLQRRKR